MDFIWNFSKQDFPTSRHRIPLNLIYIDFTFEKDLEIAENQI